MVEVDLWNPGQVARCSASCGSLLQGRSLAQSVRAGKPRGATPRKPARNGPTDLGQKDCHDRADRLEERGVLRRPISETTNSLSVSDRVRSIVGIFSGGGRWVLETLGFESESQL